MELDPESLQAALPAGQHLTQDEALVSSSGKFQVLDKLLPKLKHRALVFDFLLEAMKGACAALHGDIPQAQRENTLKGFRDGKFPILIATDVAARGLDIAGVELVLQCEPPERCEDYICRSGRTHELESVGAMHLRSAAHDYF